MKFIFLSYLMAGSVHAASFDPKASQVCTKFFTCGHFKGPGGPLGQKTQFQEEITISATGDLSGRVVLNLAMDHGQSEPEAFDLTFEFNEDGQFVTTSKKGLYASGICKDGRCTYGMIPFTSNGHQVANAGIFRFSPQRLERFMFVIEGNETYQQLTDLKAD